MVTGTINPVEEMIHATMIAGEDTLSTYSDIETGVFTLAWVPEGMYDLLLTPISEEYQVMTLEDVEVIAEQTTDLGVIDLIPVE